MIVLHAQIWSFGEIVDVPIKCSRCQNVDTLEAYNLTDIDVKYLDDSEDSTIPFSLIDGYKDKDGALHYEGSLQLATGAIQENVIKAFANNTAKATTATLAACIKNIGAVEHITSREVSMLSSRDRGEIGEAIMDKLPGPQLFVQHQCSSCDHDWKAIINPVNFRTGSRRLSS